MSEHIDIYNILTNGDKKTLFENVLEEMDKIFRYCDHVLGEGYFGKVTRNTVGAFFNVNIGKDNTVVTMPIVVKQSKRNGTIAKKEIGNVLFIYSNDNMTCEAMMLYMVSKLWYKGISPNLPFLVAAGNCDNNPQITTHLMLEFNGLSPGIVIDRTKMLFSMKHNFMYYTRYSTLTTFYDLCIYMLLNMDDKLMCKLPNNVIVYVPEIVDNFIISFLYTSNLLWNKLKLTLLDQHYENIYTHWINDTSYSGDRSLSELKTICFQLDKNKYLRINTHGIIFKIGDIGSSVMIPQKNVYIIGDIATQNVEMLKIYANKIPVYLDTLTRLSLLMPQIILSNTKIYKILSKDPFNKYYFGNGIKMDEINKYPTDLDVLNDPAFAELIVDKVSDDKNNFVVKL